MKRAIFVALLLTGCRADVEADRARAETMCHQWVTEGLEKNMSECVATTMQNYAKLNRRTITFGGGGGGGYSGAVPASDAPALQNIIPPTVRCQSVPAGMGTVQTVCR